MQTLDNSYLQIVFHQSPMSHRTSEVIKAKCLSPFCCPNCQSVLEQHENVKYCPECKQCPAMIDDYLREPNYNIKQNLMDLKSTPMNKIHSHVKDIFCKLNMKATEEQLSLIGEKVLYMHRKRGPNRKGYKEQTAAVIFKDFQDQIRMSVHQFCLKTGLLRKKFNKMYMKYTQLNNQSNKTIKKNNRLKIENQIGQDGSSKIKREQIFEDVSEPIQQLSFMENYEQQNKELQKVQQKEDQKSSKLKQHEEERSYNINREEELDQFKIEEERQTIRKTIAKLYDHIFTSFYLKNYKSELIASITDKAVTIAQIYYNSRPLNLLKSYFRVPAIIYCVIKLNGYRITTKKYLQLVQKCLEVVITTNMINKFSILCKETFPKAKTQDDFQASSPSTLQNRNNSQLANEQLRSRDENQS